MKQASILLLACLACLTGRSQILFEPGYFITNENEKIECLIKNHEWYNTPKEFKYKLSQKSEVKRASVMDVKEFAVIKYVRFVSKVVEIDRSSDNVNFLSKNKNPTFHQERLFLKVLVEGNAVLYHYQKKDISRFFYQVNQDTIKQLVYKRYLSGLTERQKFLGMEPYRIYNNNFFKQQILNEVACVGTPANELDRVKYVSPDLVKIFLKYNKCN